MERKLSQKAAQMRQRLFTRSLHSRGRAATMNASASPSTSSSRSRSATTPVSSHPTGLAFDTEPTRYYQFTDEPGYFIPAEPLIHRQDIEEDLEDDVKHSCGLLVESIERGLPIWPSFPENGALHSHESRPGFQGVMAQLSLSPVAIDNHIPNEWDSGDLHSSKSTRPQNSFSMSASAGTGRFYGKRLSTPPPEEEEYDSRPRGRSIGTETTRSRSRSRSESPDLFPYSPPQFENTWGRDNTQILEPDFPESDFLGAEGTTWLSALDIQTNEHWTSSSVVDLPKDTAGTCMTSVPNTATGPATRRFYSTRQKTNPVETKARDWDAFQSREPGLYRGLSMGNLSEKRPTDFSYPLWKEGDSPDALGLYDAPTRHRRRRAQELLKKLTGLGMKRKEGIVEGRRAITAVA
ncbi:hypothetical protein N7507_004095 [Penicillium longicatenatum]|nr:hypothetical protein N7507_004095 [Penicillium longicatenatum]